MLQWANEKEGKEQHDILVVNQMELTKLIITLAS